MLKNFTAYFFVLVSLMALIFSGCAGMPRIQVEPLVQDLAAYELGYRFAKNNQELVATSQEVCNAILESSDEAFIQDLVLASVLSLSERMKDEHDRALIVRIAKGIKIIQNKPTEEEPNIPPYSFGDVSARDIKTVVQSFKDGLDAAGPVKSVFSM